MKTIQIDNKHYIECSVVMLLTDKSSSISYKYAGREGLQFGNPKSLESSYEFQHLYLLSDEEIKEGDWIYNSAAKNYPKIAVQKLKKDFVEDANSISYIKKIIATTNAELNIEIIEDEGCLQGGWENLNLPNISEEFIQKWVKNPVDKVLVEVDDVWFPEIRYKISSENTISTIFIETDFIGKETIEYCKKYEGTDKYNVAMLAIEFGFQLALKYKELK